jgi:hypothetical protein
MEKIAIYVHNFMNRRILNNSMKHGDSDTFDNAQKPKVGEGGKKFQSIFRTEPQGL